MDNYIGIGCLILLLIISFWISKDSFKNWYKIDSKDKYYALRAPIIIIVGIILLILRIFKS